MSSRALHVGDVVLVGGKEFVVDMVNDSRARAIPALGTVKEVKSDGATVATFECSKWVNMATTISQDLWVRNVGGAAGIKDFLDTARARRAEDRNNNRAQETEHSMKTKEKKAARGGLAASAAESGAATGGKRAKAPKAAKDATETGSKGKLGHLMGFSVCAVLRRLGAEGVSASHAEAIMNAMGQSVAKPTITIQVGAGRRGQGKAAELTGSQVKELKAAAAEPEKAKETAAA